MKEYVKLCRNLCQTVRSRVFFFFLWTHPSPLPLERCAFHLLHSLKVFNLKHHTFLFLPKIKHIFYTSRQGNKEKLYRLSQEQRRIHTIGGGRYMDNGWASESMYTIPSTAKASRKKHQCFRFLLFVPSDYSAQSITRYRCVNSRPCCPEPTLW